MQARIPRDIPDGVTTLVIRNVPWEYTQDELQGEWPPDGTYDYLHLPLKKEATASVGYAFMNFATHDLAMKFTEKWHGRHLHRGDLKTLNIAVAQLQGVYPNFLRFGRDSVEQAGRLPDVLPVVYLGDGTRANDQFLRLWLKLGLQAEGLVGAEAGGPRVPRPLPQDVPMPANLSDSV